MQENKLIFNKHILIINADICRTHGLENFCGIIVNNADEIQKIVVDSKTIIYMTGNIEENYECIINNAQIKIIKELSHNYEFLGESDDSPVPIISISEIPLNINNVGVLFNNFFGKKDYFEAITNEHEFQSLTESTKPGNAYRNGIYITNVTTNDDDSVGFNLLRCSTNFNGSTDNFRKTDKEIIDNINAIGELFFEEPITFNHVLAQIYNNVKVNSKEKKAKIKDHSDKTKDMPRNALMAFCTFYKDHDKYDCNNETIFTKLRFRLKKDAKELNPGLVKEFDIILRQNSVFIMSLESNRLYTHEISPSICPIDKIPTRMGYVIRCSCTKAVFKNGKTFIDESVMSSNESSLKELMPCTEENIKSLKELYYQENSTSTMMKYEPLYFSMNNGDYKMPIV